MLKQPDFEQKSRILENFWLTLQTDTRRYQEIRKLFLDDTIHYQHNRYPIADYNRVFRSDNQRDASPGDPSMRYEDLRDVSVTWGQRPC